jgi:hypothetical protein
MMVTCPKCGFSQPQDRFCAKCGVDMENFKPSAPPITKRILSNPILHIALAFVLIFVMILFIRHHSQQEITSRMEFLKGGPTIVSRQTPAKAPDSPPALQPQPPPVANLEKQPEPNAEDSRKSLDAVNVNLLFTEVDHQTMESLRQDSRATGQFTEFGDFKAGALPTTKKAISERGVRVLYRAQEKMDHERMSASATVGDERTDTAPVGVSYIITLTHLEGNTIRGEIEVAQIFHETQDLNDPPVQRSYPSTTFELTPGMSWMVTLNLPTVTQEDADSASTEGLMRIFQSPQYKSKQTEFTLFFEFDRPALNSNAGKNVK